jgi:hypothetical protein
MLEFFRQEDENNKRQDDHASPCLELAPTHLTSEVKYVGSLLIPPTLNLHHIFIYQISIQRVLAIFYVKLT